MYVILTMKQQGSKYMIILVFSEEEMEGWKS